MHSVAFVTFQQAPAALLDVALRQAGGFLLQRPEAEPRHSRLRDYEAPILEQQFAALGKKGFRLPGCELFDAKWCLLPLCGSHDSSLR